MSKSNGSPDRYGGTYDLNPLLSEEEVPAMKRSQITSLAVLQILAVISIVLAFTQRHTLWYIAAFVSATLLIVMVAVILYENLIKHQ